MEYNKNLQVIRYDNIGEKQKILDEAIKQSYKWRSGHKIDENYLYDTINADRYIILDTQSKTVSQSSEIHNSLYGINILTFKEFFNTQKTTNEDILEVLNNVTSV